MNITSQDRHFTTFEAAKVCGVFHTTVINWVNKGMLKAYHTPGGHRRIPLGGLVDFMQRFEMPIPDNLVLRRRKVLVVEDDPAVQRMLMRTLEGIADIDIQACSGGLEALIAIGKDSPDLLVLDIGIPQVNGLEVCKVLRAGEHTKPIRILAVSGEVLSREEEQALREMTDGFLRKPLDTSEFRERAVKWLELEPAPA